MTAPTQARLGSLEPRAILEEGGGAKLEVHRQTGRAGGEAGSSVSPRAPINEKDEAATR